MTIGEITRALKSKKRMRLVEQQVKANFDYTLADLIGRSVGRLYSNNAKLPSIAEAYPNLFDSEEFEEEQQKRKDELSILRLKQFAQAHNNQLKGGDK